MIRHIYNYSAIYHWEPISKFADAFILEYEILGVFSIGQVYERLIEDISDEDHIIENY
ncbi:MAG: hypothetical protein K2G70_02170 [Turicibacter sp.]|nr:hypothetical protein [Turicibacter sp.]